MEFSDVDFAVVFVLALATCNAHLLTGTGVSILTLLECICYTDFNIDIV